MASRKYLATKTGWSPADQVKAQEGFSCIAFGLILGAEIAHGAVGRDISDDDLARLNNFLTKRGFIPLTNHLMKSFAFTARMLFDGLSQKVEI